VKFFSKSTKHHGAAFGGTVVAFALPFFASAHEVYVLTSSEIHTALATPSFDMLAVLRGDLLHFAFWGFITVLVIFAVFFISISRRLERWFDPLFLRARHLAAPVARITVGISFLAAAYYQASYGPELPLLPAYGAYTPLITGVLIVIGILIIFGIYARLTALIALLLFTYAVARNGMYMFTYTNYLGEILVLLILGSHHGASPRKQVRQRSGPLGQVLRPDLLARLAPYSFALLRFCFGVSLFYASLYAKILHNNLALDVASLPLGGHMGTIAMALGFEPHFLVLGAAIIEIVIALFFILGIEIRFTSLFLLFWLSLSLLYFGEVVWPHIILIGIPIAFILYGYDKYSLEGWLFKKKGGWEPVL
jgi:uncharacterized membrane protein YphA (DoxX/SURF4 family)